jgi:hypothetical protein
MLTSVGETVKRGRRAPRWRLQRPLPWRLVTAGVLASVAALGVFFTPLHEEPVPIAKERSAGGTTSPTWDPWEWFAHPLELNPAGLITKTTAAIADICIVPKSGRVWICGEGGLTAHSDDHGETWKQEPLPDGGARSAYPAAQRCGGYRKTRLAELDRDPFF